MKFGTKKEVEEAAKNAAETVNKVEEQKEMTQDWIIDPAKEKAKKKQKEDKVKKKGDSKESNTSTLVLGGVLLLALILGGGFFFIKGRQPKNVDDGPKVIENKIDPLEDMTSAINTMYNNGALVGMQIDPEEDLSIMYYYDHNGKAYAESPYINGLFISKDKSLTEKQDGNGEYFFNIVDDMTPLYMMETMLSVAQKTDGSIKNITSDEEKAVNCRTYQVDINGSGIADVFSVVSNNYCTEQLKTLYDLNSSSELSVSHKLRLLMTIGNGDGQVAAAIFIIKDNTPYILYNFEGYTSIGGWELDEKVWNKDMDVNNYKNLRSDYQSVQTFCGAQIEKWLTEHPEIVNSLGNRVSEPSTNENSEVSTENVESSASDDSEESK